MNRKLIWLVVIIIILVAGYFIFFNKKPASGETVRIGIIVTGTGPGAYQGEQALRGLELAKEEINKSGGINSKPVELIIEDSKTEPAAAVSAMNKIG